MREEIVTKYITDDNIAFEERLDCLNYEKLCKKYKNWLYDGKIMFWNHYEKYINFGLQSGVAGVNYLEWLKEQLSTGVGYIKINEHPCDEHWKSVWEFVVKFCNLADAEIKNIESTYCEGDLLVYDPHDCSFHNIDLVVRNTTAAKERLNNDLVQKVLAANKEGKNAGTC